MGFQSPWSHTNFTLYFGLSLCGVVLLGLLVFAGENQWCLLALVALVSGLIGSIPWEKGLTPGCYDELPDGDERDDSPDAGASGGREVVHPMPYYTPKLLNERGVRARAILEVVGGVLAGGLAALAVWWFESGISLDAASAAPSFVTPLSAELVVLAGLAACALTSLFNPWLHFGNKRRLNTTAAYAATAMLRCAASLVL